MRAADISATTEAGRSVHLLTENRQLQWLALAALLLLYLTFLGSRSLDGHETLVAQTAREMSRSGDYVLPTFSGLPRYQKPPLAYWLAASSYHLSGVTSELTARLPFALSGIALACLVFHVAARLFGPRCGLIAGLIQGTMAWSYLYGRSALVDITLTLLVAVAIFASAMDRWSALQSIAPLIFWTALGLAVLAKGPLALPVVLIPVILYRSLRSRHLADARFFTHRASLLGMTVFALLAFTWPMAIYRHDPTVLQLWYGQSVDRYLEHWGPNSRPWYFYVYQVPLLTLPWTPLWILELASSLRCRFQTSAEPSEQPGRDEYRLLWLWFGAGLLFFTLSEGKREHYILPVLPPLSILAALALPKWGAFWHPFVSRHFSKLRRGLYLTAALAALFGLLIAFTWSWAGLALGMAGSLAAGAALAAVQWNRWPDRHGYAVALFALAVASVVLTDAALTPRLGRRNAELALFERNRPALQEANCILQFGSNDRWTLFLLDRPMRWPRSIDELQAELEERSQPLLLVREDRLEELMRSVPVEVLDRSGNEDVPFARRDKFVLARPIHRQTIDELVDSANPAAPGASSSALGIPAHRERPRRL